MFSRSPVVAAAAVAALSTAAVAAFAASPATPPKVKLATSHQGTLLASRTADVTATAPAHSSAAIALYADRHPVTGVRRLVFNHAKSVHLALGLTGPGAKSLAACRTQALDLRMTIHRGKDTRTVHDVRSLVLDAGHCSAPKSTTAAPASTNSTDTPSTDKPPVDTPRSEQPKAPQIDVSNADHCEILVPGRCLGTWPSDYFTKKDDSTPTGLRVNLSPDATPRNAANVPINPTDMNQSDGFSPGQEIIVHVTGLDTPAAFDKSGIVPVTDIARYNDPNQPVVLVDADTGERQPIWAELDANATTADQRDLLIHPAKNLIEGHRYVVALRNLRTTDDQPIQANDAFRIYRDKLPSDQPEIDQRRGHFESLFSTLKRAGIGRDDLYLTWDFTVASTQNITSRMIHIRDDAFAQLGDHDLGDLDVTGNSPKSTITSVTNFTAAQNAHWARRIHGTVTVPCYLSSANCAAGGTFVLDADGNPIQNPTTPTTEAPFSCNIPRRTIDNPTSAKLKPTLYGHGLFGSYTQVEGNDRGDLANAGGMLLCATDWKGMAGDDVNNLVANVLPDMSHFSQVADRLQQGLLNFLYLGRAMIHPSGLATDPAFQADRGNGMESLVDTSRLYYTGISEGGILGGALTAIAPDFTRAALTVPGMNYSVLLPRSSDYPEFGQVLNAYYPVESDRMLILSMAQLLWDRGEPNGYANHMTDNPLPNTPRHRVLLEAGVGDHQVANVTTDTLARTIGASVRTPATDPGRSYEVTPDWNVPAISTWPFTGNALVWSDIGPLRAGGTLGTPLAPTTNTAPNAGVDPHRYAGQDPRGQAQIAQFLSPGGAVVDNCGAAPCYAAGWTGS